MTRKEDIETLKSYLRYIARLDTAAQEVPAERFYKVKMVLFPGLFV